jgi:hypothetical protein
MEAPDTADLTVEPHACDMSAEHLVDFTAPPLHCLQGFLGSSRSTLPHPVDQGEE